MGVVVTALAPGAEQCHRAHQAGVGGDVSLPPGPTGDDPVSGPVEAAPCPAAQRASPEHQQVGLGAGVVGHGQVLVAEQDHDRRAGPAGRAARLHRAPGVVGLLPRRLDLAVVGREVEDPSPAGAAAVAGAVGGRWPRTRSSWSTASAVGTSWLGKVVVATWPLGVTYPIVVSVAVGPLSGPPEANHRLPSESATTPWRPWPAPRWAPRSISRSTRNVESPPLGGSTSNSWP